MQGTAETTRRIVNGVRLGEHLYRAGDEEALASLLRREDVERLVAAGELTGDWSLSERDPNEPDFDTHTKQPDDDGEDKEDVEDGGDEEEEDGNVITEPDTPTDGRRRPAPSTPPKTPTPPPPAPKPVPPVPTPPPTPPRSHKRKP